jgi:hypothetical protein
MLRSSQEGDDEATQERDPTSDADHDETSKPDPATKLFAVSGLQTIPRKGLPNCCSRSEKLTGEDDGEYFELSLTHQEIADVLGLTRQTVMKVFSEFRRERLLRASGTTVSIFNQGLEQIVHF